MTDDLQIQRARHYGHDGFAEYLAARAELRPARPPAAEVHAARVDCGAGCVRAAGHTGDHLPPLEPHNPPHEPETAQTAQEMETSNG